jgi:hypothetical protein
MAGCLPCLHHPQRGCPWSERVHSESKTAPCRKPSLIRLGAGFRTSGIGIHAREKQMNPHQAGRQADKSAATFAKSTLWWTILTQISKQPTQVGFARVDAVSNCLILDCLRPIRTGKTAACQIGSRTSKLRNRHPAGRQADKSAATFAKSPYGDSLNAILETPRGAGVRGVDVALAASN